jgi:2-iminobutanoate/2-iminopropanoate deaminase
LFEGRVISALILQPKSYMNHSIDNRSIRTANSQAIPTPGGHYSHVCTAAGLAHISGQLPIDAQGKPMTGQSFEAQALQVLSNLQACLQAVGLTPNDLVQVRIYLTDIENWPTFNQLYAQWLGEHRPARIIAGVAALHYGLELEVEAVALAATRS